jgi:hypothetical protein
LRLTALAAELVEGKDFGSAARTGKAQFGPSLTAESVLGRILGPAILAVHLSWFPLALEEESPGILVRAQLQSRQGLLPKRDFWFLLGNHHELQWSKSLISLKPDFHKMSCFGRF